MAEMETHSWRPFRLSLVATLLLISLQMWTGDFVNVFVTTATKVAPAQNIAGFFQAITSNTVFLLWHGMEGLLILLSAIGVVAISFRYHRNSVKVCAILGLITVIVAGLGGYLFVLSGFSNGGNSMQMGGAGLAAYAFYFLALYYTK